MPADLPIAPGEPLLPMATAVHRATGRRTHVTTCHRWRLRGVRGVRLPTVLVGGRRLTSVGAVLRWIEATQPDGEAAPATRGETSRQRQAAIERAERELREAGV